MASKELSANAIILREYAKKSDKKEQPIHELIKFAESKGITDRQVYGIITHERHKDCFSYNKSTKIVCFLQNND